MSYALYGFGEIPNFRLNEPGQVSPIGEMTKENYTYSNEIERYSLTRYPNSQFISLSSERDGVEVAVGLTYQELMLHVTEWLYNRSITGNVPADVPTLLQALRAEFGDIADIKEIGDIIYKDSYLFPTYITLSATNAGEANDLYIWYSHQSLENFYPNSDYTGILPVVNTDIDKLAGDRDQAIALLNAITIVNHNSRVDAAAQGHPQTYLITMNFKWHDKDNPDISADSPFSVLCYGPQSKNIDMVKEYLRNLILSLSEHGEDVWSVIYPELFVPTEFYVIPQWDKVALPNKAEGTGIYSSSMRLKNVLPYALKYCKGYSEDHLRENLGIHAANYQEVIFLSCGNPQNYAAKPAFDEQWPAYSAVDTKSPDFGRIPPATQVMIMQLNGLFKAAEVATEHTIIPQDMTRTVRDGVYYLTTSVDNIQFLCPIKKDFGL
ncbi:hypothetical protein NRE35_004306 [Salmonella enterica]|nr:hypothetical protein [Salmonella enterica subsp. enterica serovar Oslo]EEX4841953.1 hypothetical protein [Escherichia coli]EJO2543940.1 hypothetical protein [Salmonella enterica]ELF5187161.1 hypothetical protein [Salmonella enterica]